MCANCEVCLIFTGMASSYGSLHTDLFQPDSVHNTSELVILCKFQYCG